MSSDRTDRNFFLYIKEELCNHRMIRVPKEFIKINGILVRRPFLSDVDD